MWSDFFLFVSTVLTSTLSGTLGAAGGTTLLALLTLVLPPLAIVPLHGVNQLLSNSFRAYLLKKNVRKKLFLFFSVGAITGVFCAYLFLSSLSSEKLPLIFILILILYTVFKPKKLPDLKLSDPLFGVLGAVAGFLGVFMGATGLLLAPFFLRDDFTKEETIANQACCQIVTHFLKIPVFISLGFPYFSYAGSLVLMAVGTFIGTYFGVKWLEGMNPSIFVKLYKTVLFLVSFHLIYKIL